MMLLILKNLITFFEWLEKQKDVSHNLSILPFILFATLLFSSHCIENIKAYRKVKWLLMEFQPIFENF